jgi:hypothetical protein
MSDFFEIHDINAIEEIYKFRCENQHIEREYLELRVLLQKAEAELRQNQANQEFQAKVQYLKKRIDELEKSNSWISSAKSREIALWAPQAG